MRGRGMQTSDRGQLGDELATIVTVRGRTGPKCEGLGRAGSVVGGFQGIADLRGPSPPLAHPALGPDLEPAGPAECPQPACITQLMGLVQSAARSLSRK